MGIYEKPLPDDWGVIDGGGEDWSYLNLPSILSVYDPVDESSVTTPGGKLTIANQVAGGPAADEHGTGVAVYSAGSHIQFNNAGNQQMVGDPFAAPHTGDELTIFCEVMLDGYNSDGVCDNSDSARDCTIQTRADGGWRIHRGAARDFIGPGGYLLNRWYILMARYGPTSHDFWVNGVPLLTHYTAGAGTAQVDGVVWGITWPTIRLDGNVGLIAHQGEWASDADAKSMMDWLAARRAVTMSYKDQEILQDPGTDSAFWELSNATVSGSGISLPETFGANSSAEARFGALQSNYSYDISFDASGVTGTPEVRYATTPIHTITNGPNLISGYSPGISPGAAALQFFAAALGGESCVISNISLKRVSGIF